MTRIAVRKTAKLYIGGSFVRTESGRYQAQQLAGAAGIVNIPWASRKDARDAVVAARGAQAGWMGRSAYNRGQILYRVAEMLEGRRDTFAQLRVDEGLDRESASAEVDAAIETWVYYAGWCDKFTQVFSSVNPVASSHFNFSIPEPTGVVAAFQVRAGLAHLSATLASIMCVGNTGVVVSPIESGNAMLAFAEVLATSDVPAGAVNLLTSDLSELVAPLGSHLDVNAVVLCGHDDVLWRDLQGVAPINVKRCIQWNNQPENPYRLVDVTETKTTWHPIGW